jgi:hypothetical protein
MTGINCFDAGIGRCLHGEDVDFSTATLRGLERTFGVTLQLDEA